MNSLDCCKHNLMSLSDGILKDHNAERNADSGALALGVSKENKDSAGNWVRSKEPGFITACSACE